MSSPLVSAILMVMWRQKPGFTWRSYVVQGLNSTVFFIQVGFVAVPLGRRGLGWNQGSCRVAGPEVEVP